MSVGYRLIGRKHQLLASGLRPVSVVASLLLAIVAQGGLSSENPNWVYDTVIGKGTGANGYEEYCRAADFVRQRKIEVLVNQSQLTPNLATRTEAVEACLPVFDLIKKGNAKRVSDNRKLGINTLFPQFAYFKTIAKLYQARIYVQQANGRPDAAVDALLDALTFFEKTAQDTLIAYLVYAALNSIVFAELEPNIASLGVKQCDRIISYCNAALDRPLPLVQCLNGEILFLEELKTGALPLDDVLPAESLVEFQRLLPADRATILNEVHRRGVASIRQAQGFAKQPESSWDSLPIPQPDEGADLITNSIANVISIPVFSQVFVVAAKTRTQMRLLRLHAALAKHRWENRIYPSDLSKLDESLTFDPVADRKFVYKRDDKGYELFSSGLASTGPIHLRYQRPPTPENRDLPPN